VFIMRGSCFRVRCPEEIHGSGPDHAGLPKDLLPAGQAAMQMDSFFRAEPYLKHRYRSFFAVAVPPPRPAQGYAELMEVGTIPRKSCTGMSCSACREVRPVMPVLLTKAQPGIMMSSPLQGHVLLAYET
jgi:hypothetical protein